MAIDLVCGQCEGRLLAEEPGSVVACPHCGAHLQVPGEEPSEAAAGPVEAVESPAEEIPVAETAVAETATEGHGIASPPETSQPDSMLTIAGGLVAGHEVSPSSDTFQTDAESNAEIPAVSFAAMPQLGSHQAAPIAEPIAAPVATSVAPVAAGTVPRFWFLVAVSYASAVTLAFLFLLLTLGRMRTHPLENLPDVVPKVQSGEVALEVAPPDADVPRGHVLRLGESQRFGSLKVTPLRVTEGPLKFEHRLHETGATRAVSQPVLKLWLRFENVSRNQTFSPLDSLLLFKRHYQDLGRVLTNQFLCRADQRRKDGDLHHVYELSSSSEFRIAGQHLDAVLGPGDSVETFVPSEENIDDLTGDLVWRVQFRKGYHPSTRHGVTTLIDVPFQRSDVKMDG